MLTYLPFDFELGCLLVFALFFHKLTQIEKLVAGIILANFMVDVITAEYSDFNGLNRDNQWLFNWLIPPFLTFTAYFYSLILPVRYQKHIYSGIVIFLILHILNCLYGQGMSRLSTFTILPAQAGIGFLAFLNLRDIVEHQSRKPITYFLFWFSVAVMINYFATIPVTATLSWFPYDQIAIADQLYNLNSVLGYYIYFTIITFGLIWTRRYPQ